MTKKVYEYTYKDETFVMMAVNEETAFNNLKEYLNGRNEGYKIPDLFLSSWR